jgi:hypothetical protein
VAWEVYNSKKNDRVGGARVAGAELSWGAIRSGIEWSSPAARVTRQIVRMVSKLASERVAHRSGMMAKGENRERRAEFRGGEAKTKERRRRGGGEDFNRGEIGCDRRDGMG